MAVNYCSNCFYCGSVEGGRLQCCNYLLITNQRRPCPPGDGCTVKVGKKVKWRKKKGCGNNG